MALVDYSSSSEASDGADINGAPPPAKRPKHGPDQSQSSGADHDGASGAATGDMPPLPSAFHDLYASTVRQSVVDDPSLHQGRRRLNPHVAGHWPTHLYVKWHPSQSQHAVLVQLLNEIEVELSDQVKLHNFLSSDLGAPLPLHISLSRPIVFETRDKDRFLDTISSSLEHSGIPAFAVVPHSLAWYKSPDSDRTFLVIQVRSHTEPESAAIPQNGELMGLLKRCNTVVTAFDQPALYQKTLDEAAGSAFHVSIGWTFDQPSEDLCLRTLKLFRQRKFAAMREWDIDVSGIKAKIGNVVSHVPLSQPGRRASNPGSLYD